MNKQKESISRIADLLNDDENAWRHFLDSPGEFLIAQGLDTDEVLYQTFVEMAQEARQPVIYKPGWPISRLQKDKKFDTYSILMNQHRNFCLPVDGDGKAAPEPADNYCFDLPGDFFIPDCDIILIVPPWADINRPSIGVHILEGIAKEKGYQVQVVYSNVIFAALIGERYYQSVAYAPQAGLIGEGLFSAEAYSLPSILRRGGSHFRRFLQDTASKMKTEFSEADIRMIESASAYFAAYLAERVAAAGARLVGCTSTFEQTSAGLAIINAVKKRAPDVITIIGGANCEGEMADGIASIGSRVDYIFSGESEKTFADFLDGFSRGEMPDRQIIRGAPLKNMDSLPHPDYTAYYNYRKRFLPFPADEKGKNNLWLSYETTRGCWWGDTIHCTFCGLNGEGMSSRSKSEEKVISELTALLQQHPSSSVWMVDNIMPRHYIKKLLPLIAEKFPGLFIYWDQKSNLRLEDVRLMTEAGIGIIQPGIEAMDSELLKLMGKGVKSWTNIMMLRYTRSFGLAETWNILFAFPGDKPEHYTRQTELFRMIHHLQPPSWVARVNIDRFSPYFRRPQDFGVKNLQPFPAYRYTFPQHSDINRIAYHFYGDFESAVKNDPENLLRPLADEFDCWREDWCRSEEGPPVLHVFRVDDEHFLLADTRRLAGTKRIHLLDRKKALVALACFPSRFAEQDAASWALQNKIALALDDRIVPLATASSALLREMENCAREIFGQANGN